MNMKFIYLCIISFILISCFGESKDRKINKEGISYIDKTKGDCNAFNVYLLQRKYGIYPGLPLEIDMDEKNDKIKEKGLKKLAFLIKNIDQWWYDGGFAYPPENQYKLLRTLIKKHYPDFFINEIYFMKNYRVLIILKNKHQNNEIKDVYFIKVNNEWYKIYEQDANIFITD